MKEAVRQWVKAAKQGLWMDLSPAQKKYAKHKQMKSEQKEILWRALRHWGVALNAIDDFIEVGLQEDHIRMNPLGQITHLGLPAEIAKVMGGKSHASFAGDIPEELGKLSQLKGLILNNHALTGEVPSSLGDLSNLKTLELRSNQLSEQIPSSFGNLTKLEELLLDRNQFVGELPPSLGNLGNLEYLWVDWNQLTGQIPEEIGNCTNLSRLILANNQFYGYVPESFSKLVNLSMLNLANNEELYGYIPKEVPVRCAKFINETGITCEERDREVDKAAMEAADLPNPDGGSGEIGDGGLSLT